MIPADSPDHKKEFEILRYELEKYNPELLDKRFVIAISKCDLLDDELITAIRKELPPDIPEYFYIFCHAIRNSGPERPALVHYER